MVTRLFVRSRGVLSRMWYKRSPPLPPGTVYALVDTGCRFCKPELEDLSDRASIKGAGPIKIVSVYEQSYDPTQFGISRKEAMFNFYVVDQSGKKHKNMDAMLFLYGHTDLIIPWLLIQIFYYPLKLGFEKIWLPHRFKLYGRDDVLMQLRGDKKYMQWAEDVKKLKPTGR